jgi:hypothetical protein
MPIDISREPPITLSEAAAHVPRRRRGRKTAVTTLYRWSSAGVRGVKLETIQVGGSRCTSLAALQRFFDRLTTHGLDPGRPTRSAEGPTARRAANADRELDRLWNLSKAK